MRHSPDKGPIHKMVPRIMFIKVLITKYQHRNINKIFILNLYCIDILYLYSYKSFINIELLVGMY